MVRYYYDQGRFRVSRYWVKGRWKYAVWIGNHCLDIFPSHKKALEYLAEKDNDV